VNERGVVDVTFNWLDDQGFANASLDRMIRFWNLESGTIRFTLMLHPWVVNCLEFIHDRAKPRFASSSDDSTMTLTDHRGNVNAIRLHPFFLLMFSTAEDG
jgi:WD40 repeat protein